MQTYSLPFGGVPLNSRHVFGCLAPGRWISHATHWLFCPQASAHCFSEVEGNCCATPTRRLVALLQCSSKHLPPLARSCQQSSGRAALALTSRTLRCCLEGSRTLGEMEKTTQMLRMRSCLLCRFLLRVRCQLRLGRSQPCKKGCRLLERVVRPWPCTHLIRGDRRRFQVRTRHWRTDLGLWPSSKEGERTAKLGAC